MLSAALEDYHPHPPTGGLGKMLMIYIENTLIVNLTSKMSKIYERGLHLAFKAELQILVRRLCP